MQYIPQHHQMGCLIAALAMVLDMNYEQVSETIPLEGEAEMEALLLTGRNSSGLQIFDQMKVLAERRGNRVIDFEHLPKLLQPGLRYLGIISTHNPLIHHVVAIDERGIVFDPDPAKGESRQHWLMYEFKAVLGFERVSALEQLASESAPNVFEEDR